VQGAEIADRIFGFELEVSGEDLAGGVILKADESKGGAAAFEPVVTAGIGQRHHAKARAGRAAGAIFARPALLRRGEFRGPQDAPHGLAADGKILFSTKLFRQMRIVEALILASGLGSRSTASGEEARPTAWSVRDCRTAPSPRNRADSGV